MPKYMHFMASRTCMQEVGGLQWRTWASSHNRDLAARLQTLEAGFASADERLDRIESLALRILDAVEEQGRRMQGLENAVARLDARIERLEQRMGAFEQRMDRLETRMNRLDMRMDALESRIGNLENRMDRTESRHDISDGRLANIETMLGEHSVMDHKHDLNFQTAEIAAEFMLREAKSISERQFALERDSRRCHWIAFGVAASAAGALALARGN